MFFITLFCLGMGGWFFYDGAVGFPQKNVIYDAHKKFVDENREEAWPEHARQQGWKAEAPEKRYDAASIKFQFVLGAVSTAVGLATLGWVAMCWRRVLKSEADAVWSDTGVRIPLTAMRSIDMKRWQSKGIATVLYEDGDGGTKKLLLDDYKYVGGEEILHQVERHLGITREGEEEEEKPAEAEESS